MALEVRVSNNIRIKARRFPREAFFALLFDKRGKHILFSIHKDYKGLKSVYVPHKEVHRVYLGYLEIEVTRRVVDGKR